MKRYRIVGVAVSALTFLSRGAESISQAEMEAVYAETRTPYKIGLVLKPENGEMLDNPMVFRHGDAWYMMFIRYDGRGYETHLARSDNLLKWTRLGCIFSRAAAGQWDSAQADGWPALVDTQWEGPNTLNTFQGKYWMMYLGGSAEGYETDPLSTGVAWTTDPSAVREWTRYEGNPVLSPSDSDARDFERKTIYKHFTVEDPSRSCGGRFVNFYNAKQNGVWRESIGMAVSDDMLHWQRVGTRPVVDNGVSGKSAISGDPMVKKIGDLWVMFYYGYKWKEGVNGAFDTFACSRDLINWTKWEGPPLLKPSEPFDSSHAHKPWVLKHDGTVYHFYCAVSSASRGIALAVSKPVVSLDPSYWVNETAETTGLTGTWTGNVAFHAGTLQAQLPEKAVFTPNTPSGGNCAVLTVTAAFSDNPEYARTPDADAQGAVWIGTNGSFQAWTCLREGDGGQAENGWVDVVANDVTPTTGVDYTFRFTFDYRMRVYSVTVSDGGEQKPLVAASGSALPAGISRFPLATRKSAVSSLKFSGSGVLTSILGEYGRKAWFNIIVR